MNDFDKLRKLTGEVADLAAAFAVLEWDQQVYMPPGAAADRACQMETLAGELHRRITAPAVGRLLDRIDPESYPEDSFERAFLRKTRRRFERERKVPARLASAQARAAARAHTAWVTAREKADYRIFAPHLAELLDLAREYAALFAAPGESLSDPLLDLYEPGISSAALDRVFAPLRRELSGIAREAAERTASWLLPAGGKFNAAGQVAFARETVRRLGYDFRRGRLDLTIHPFTTSFELADVRITTAVRADSPVSCLLSAVHECGHALYEQGIDPAFDRTPLADGASLGFHESQSRFWENQVGRSREFWEYLWPKFRKRFAAAASRMEFEPFYRSILRVTPSEIRTEADEVTYNLHILLRYDLEKEMLAGTVDLRDLPEIWNAKMRESLGVSPLNDTVGVLQDIHWAGGSFGYFPTYALGNLIAAQLWSIARRRLPDLPEEIRRGNFRPLLDFLRETVHRHGAKYEPAELLRRITGSPEVDPACFLSYLREKYLA